MKKRIICLILAFLTLIILPLINNNIKLSIVNKVYQDGLIDGVDDGIVKAGNVTVSIDLLDGKVNESIKIETNNDYDDNYIENLSNLYHFGKKDNYNISYEKFNDILIIKASSNDNKSFEEYLKSNKSRVSSCYEEVVYDYNKETKKYSFFTTQIFKCMNINYMEFESIDFVIKTYNTVYNNNADRKSGRSYIWHFTQDNAKNKKITFVVGNGTYVWYYYLRFLFYGLCIVAAILFVLYLVVSMFKHFSDKANKM